MLVAAAQRDLAYLWARQGETAAAKEMARTARATFHRLGSKVEIEKLTALLTAPSFGTPAQGRAEAPEPGVALPVRDPSIPKDETLGPS
jgi:hypothetical protein